MAEWSSCLGKTYFGNEFDISHLAVVNNFVFTRANSQADRQTIKLNFKQVKITLVTRSISFLAFPASAFMSFGFCETVWTKALEFLAFSGFCQFFKNLLSTLNSLLPWRVLPSLVVKRFPQHISDPARRFIGDFWVGAGRQTVLRLLTGN